MEPIKQHEQRARQLLIAMAILSAAGIAGVIGGLFLNSGFFARLLWTPNLLAAAESILLAVLCFLCSRVRGGKSLVLLAGLMSVAAYLHQTLLAFVLSGLYLSGIAAGVRLLWCLCERRKIVAGGISAVKKDLEQASIRRMCAVSSFFCMLQLLRINIAADYDSLHYGLRSAYVLDNGKGIFENLGQINTVYTYPKGFEILTLPLTTMKSYAFQICCNFWILIVILIVSAAILMLLTNSRRAGYFGAMLIAMVPGVTNMALTSKSDLITLLFQLLMVYAFLKQRVLLASSIGILTLIFKPTAIVFSTITWICCAVMTLFRRDRVRAGWFEIPCLAASVFSVYVVWGRTYLMTGLPLTSVFTSVWESIGFRSRWPYSFFSMPSEGLDRGIWAGILNFIRRMLLVLFAPVGPDMDHVRMAWSGIFVLMALGIVLLLCWKKMAEYGYLFLLTLVVTVACGGSLFMLWQVDGNYFMLGYVLLILSAVCILNETVEWWELYGKREPKQIRTIKGRFSKLLRLNRVLCSAAIVCMALVTLLSGWAGAVGFTPIRLLNPGYYNNIEDTKQRRQEDGSLQTWTVLSSNPRNRVIVFDQEPYCYEFLCNAQSYTDIAGSGGNVLLVKSIDYFKEFLVWAKTDYVYVDTRYLLSHETEEIQNNPALGYEKLERYEEGMQRASSLLYNLIEDNVLTDLVQENGSGSPVFVARINSDRTLVSWKVPKTEAQTEDSEKNKEIFENAWMAGQKQ